MSGLFRAARFVAALTMLVFTFAAPAMAADAGGIQLASLSVSAPAAPAPAPVPSFESQPSAAGFVSQGPASAAPASLYRPQTPDVVETAPAQALQQVTRSLHDMVISFVDFGNQDEQQECLAKAVYFEARSETLEGQLAVAEVVLNRAASGIYPPTICDVVTQPAQFSFIQAGRFPTPDTASQAWHTALAIADIAAKKLIQQVAPNVLWYHATYVAPTWGRRLTRVTQIGTHIFYS